MLTVEAFGILLRRRQGLVNSPYGALGAAQIGLVAVEVKRRD